MPETIRVVIEVEFHKTPSNIGVEAMVEDAREGDTQAVLELVKLAATSDLGVEIVKPGKEDFLVFYEGMTAFYKGEDKEHIRKSHIPPTESTILSVHEAVQIRDAISRYLGGLEEVLE